MRIGLLCSSLVVVVVFGIAGCRTRPLHEASPRPDGGSRSDGSAGFCGDGEPSLSTGEECDDGNQDDTDGCLTGCRLARCGDGLGRVGVEACNDGNSDETDGCRSTCALPTCGDGIVQAPETCDDANGDDGDGCLSTCLLPFCGDGFVQRGLEACDDGNGDDRDACVAGCVIAVCGDGLVQRDVEQCDDANPIDDDGCDNQCHLPVCGDGVIEGDEECDDANDANDDACLTTCRLARCGDGFVQRNVEECDDGNTGTNDDCPAACERARCGDGFVWTVGGGEQCDDRNGIDSDFCDNQCRLPVCGDGKLGGNEQCDNGADNGDRPAFLVTQPTGLAIPTDPLVEAKTSSDFYDYFSASSHTGFEAAFESRAYLYVDANTGRLSLIVTHGIDGGTGGPQQPRSRVTMKIVDIPIGFTIDLSDEAMEFTAADSQTAVGDWTFEQNSDGGIMGGLPFPGVWKITVFAEFTMGISKWGWVKDDLSREALDLTQPLSIEAFDQSTACRTSCVIPRCGDGILDGGEVCDDGNNEPNDGCAPTCKSLK